MWKVIDSVINTGIDTNPVVPTRFDCRYEIPAEPELGDWYCERDIKYYLHFGASAIEVSKTVWESYTPETIYKVENGPGGARLAGS